MRQSIRRQVDKKSGEAEERGVWSSQGGGKDKHLFFSTFLSLSHFLFCFLSFFRPRTDDYTTQFKLCERK